MCTVLIFYGCKNSPQKQQASVQNPTPVQEQKLPQYKLINETVSDTQIKTQVEQNILVSGEITEDSLRSLLQLRYSELAKRTGFKNHESPTNIYIYVYDTEEKANAGQGLWLAMLQKSFNDTKPSLTIRAEQISRLGETPQEKFGLTEGERKEIFKEIARVETKATDDAIKRFPNDFNKQFKLESNLQEKYKDELAAKYSLTRDQLKAISIEGLTNRWVF